MYQASFQTSATALRQQLHWLPCYRLHVLLSRVINIIVTYLLTDQTTDHVCLQAGDPYFQREVLSHPTVSSRTASRPPGCQDTSIQYRCTALPTICVHRIRLSGVLLLCTSCLELSPQDRRTLSVVLGVAKSMNFSPLHRTCRLALTRPPRFWFAWHSAIYTFK